MELSLAEIRIGDYVEVKADGVETWIPCQVKTKSDQGVEFFLLLGDKGYKLKTRVMGDHLITEVPGWSDSCWGKKILIRPLTLTKEQLDKMRTRLTNESHR